MLELHRLLSVSLPVAESEPTTSGKPSRGWTLRRDRLNASAFRFDWIHGTGNGYRGSAAERDALREDVLAAATRVAGNAGYRVKRDAIGLHIGLSRTTANERA